jgi:flagellar biosynthesis GTPase FlhF
VERNPNCPRRCSERYQFKRSKITQCGLSQTPSQLRAKRLPNCGIRISSHSQKEAEKEEYYPGPSTTQGVSWGCSVLFTKKEREAQFRELTKQQEDEQEKARKAERKENRAAAARYQKQIAKEAKAAREVAKKEKEKEKEKKAKAENLAAARAQKQQERDAAAAQKALSTPKPKAKLKRGASQLQGGDDGGEEPSQPLQKAKHQELASSRHLTDILNRPKVLQCPIYSSTSNSCDNCYCRW